MELSRMKVLDTLNRIGYLSVQGLTSIIIVLVIGSCSSLKNLAIDVAVLPEFPIGEDVQSIAILNRSMNTRFTNIKTDSLEKILMNKKMSLDTTFRDSIAADTAIQVAAKALFESGRFDVVVPKERNIARFDTNEIDVPLKIDFIAGICKDFNVDAVLILESFSESLVTNYNQLLIDGANSGIYEFNATTDIEYTSEWRLYRPDINKLAIRYQLLDSIFWESGSYYLKDLYARLPRTKEALIGGGIASGLKIAGYISPGWVRQKRFYFTTGRSEIDAAVPLIKENRWEEAAEIWGKYTSINSKRIKGRLEFNLALASEMCGNLDLAIEWGLKSFKTNYSKAAEVYLKKLDAIRQAKLKEPKHRY